MPLVVIFQDRDQVAGYEFGCGVQRCCLRVPATTRKHKRRVRREIRRDGRVRINAYNYLEFHGTCYCLPTDGFDWAADEWETRGGYLTSYPAFLTYVQSAPYIASGFASLVFQQACVLHERSISIRGEPCTMARRET